MPKTTFKVPPMFTEESGVNELDLDDAAQHAKSSKLVPFNNEQTDFQLNPEVGIFSKSPQIPRVGLKMPEIVGIKNLKNESGDAQKSWRDKVMAKKDELSKRLQNDLQAVDLSRDSGNVTLLDASNFKVTQRQQNMF